MGTGWLNHFSSLKRQLIVYFSLSAVIPTMIISGYYYYFSVDLVESNIGKSNYKLVHHMVDNIDEKVRQAEMLMNWITMNENVTNLLKRARETTHIYDMEKKKVIDDLSNQCRYSSLANEILSIFIIGENGLDLRSGMESGLVNPEEFLDSRWFKASKVRHGKTYWGEITPNYTNITDNEYILPQSRVINDFEQGRAIGYLIMFLKDNYFFTDNEEELLDNQGEQIYLVNTFGDIISTNQSVLENIREKVFFKEILNKPNNEHFKMKIDGSMKMVAYKKSDTTNWILIHISPMTLFDRNREIVTKTTIFLMVGVLIMILFLSLYLSEYFVRPIQIIVNHVNAIAKGDFNQTISIRVQNEIGQIIQSVTKMRMDIKRLMEESVQKERDKRIIELKMLQNQVTPHFLFNTLNSIKVMAALQRAAGIENMVSALGRLLNTTLRGVNEKITLKDELSILEDYIYIQNIRYKGKIRYSKHFEDPVLLKCTVIKFILQPIVENAIFHGIEPKGGLGEIGLFLFREDEKLRIEVRDNGIGMTKTAVEKLNREIESNHVLNNGDKIGLGNIHHRIQLVYGDEYGLSIESSFQQYTKVKVLMPIEFDI